MVLDVGKGVGIGVFGELRSGDGGVVPPVPLLGSYDLFGVRLFFGASQIRTAPKTVLSRKSTERRYSIASRSTSTQTSLRVVPFADLSPSSASWLPAMHRVPVGVLGFAL